MKKTTASLVLYKTNKNDLNNVLQSVIKSDIDVLYVIDNSPSDELYFFIKKFDNKRIEYIHGQGNIGYGKGNNIAIERALEVGSKYHIILNPDIIFTGDVITVLRDFMDKYTNVGQILPRVTYPNGQIQRLCKLYPTPFNIFARRLFPSNFFSKQNELYEMQFMGYDKTWECPILSGCFMFIKTDALREVGGFDERYFMYFEDFDLMRRIHTKYSTVYYPEVTIIHNHAAEHRHNNHLLKESIRSAIKYFNKWGWFWDSERRKVNKQALNSRFTEDS